MGNFVVVPFHIFGLFWELLLSAASWLLLLLLLLLLCSCLSKKTRPTHPIPIPPLLSGEPT